MHELWLAWPENSGSLWVAGFWVDTTYGLILGRVMHTKFMLRLLYSLRRKLWLLRSSWGITMDQIGHYKWEAEMAYTKMVMVSLVECLIAKTCYHRWNWHGLAPLEGRFLCWNLIVLVFVHILFFSCDEALRRIHQSVIKARQLESSFVSRLTFVSEWPQDS